MEPDPIGSLVREKLGRFEPPPGLEASIRRQLHGQKVKRTVPSTLSVRNSGGVASVLWTVRSTWVAAAIAASLALGFFWGDRRAEGLAFGRELVSDQVRAQQTGHLIDVVSSDRHTVKPWLSARLDFSPPVADLAAQGFPLAGGRIDRVAGQPAAALVYHRRLHVVTVYVWASDRAPAAAQAELLGYAVRAWRRNGLDFAAVSDIAANDLDGFAAQHQAANP